MSERRCFRCGELLDTNKCDTETISDPVTGVLIRHLLKDDCINSLRISLSRLDRELAELRASAAGAVRVKDLEWKVDTDGIIYAQGVNIVYTIEDLGGDLFGLEAKSGEDSDSILTEDFDTLEAAKSAAQEFHAQQVLACLETGGE